MKQKKNTCGKPETYTFQIVENKQNIETLKVPS